MLGACDSVCAQRHFEPTWQHLLRVLGHEFNNSLAPIRSMTGTLLKLLAQQLLPLDWRGDVGGGGVIGARAEALTRHCRQTAPPCSSRMKSE